MTVSCLAVHIEVSPVLVNAYPVMKTPASDGIYCYINHLLNHVLIVIEADHTQILTYTLILTTNPFSILLNNPLHSSITSPFLNLNLK